MLVVPAELQNQFSELLIAKAIPSSRQGGISEMVAFLSRFLQEN
jgi:hypothetical protein